jgi:hypothetical protein
MATRHVGGTMSDPPAFRMWKRGCKRLIRNQAAGNVYYWTDPRTGETYVTAEFKPENRVVITSRGETAEYEGDDVSSLRRVGTAPGSWPR